MSISTSRSRRGGVHCSPRGSACSSTVVRRIARKADRAGFHRLHIVHLRAGLSNWLAKRRRCAPSPGRQGRGGTCPVSAPAPRRSRRDHRAARNAKAMPVEKCRRGGQGRGAMFIHGTWWPSVNSMPEKPGRLHAAASVATLSHVVARHDVEFHGLLPAAMRLIATRRCPRPCHGRNRWVKFASGGASQLCRPPVSMTASSSAPARRCRHCQPPDGAE